MSVCNSGPLALSSITERREPQGLKWPGEVACKFIVVTQHFRCSGTNGSQPAQYPEKHLEAYLVQLGNSDCI